MFSHDHLKYGDIIVIVRRYDGPSKDVYDPRWGIHEYSPVDGIWQHITNPQLVLTQAKLEYEAELTKLDYFPLPSANEIWSDAEKLLIQQSSPIQFHAGLRDGDEGVLGRIALWAHKDSAIPTVDLDKFDRPKIAHYQPDGVA